MEKASSKTSAPQKEQFPRKIKKGLSCLRTRVFQGYRFHPTQGTSGSRAQEKDKPRSSDASAKTEEDPSESSTRKRKDTKSSGSQMKKPSSSSRAKVEPCAVQQRGKDLSMHAWYKQEPSRSGAQQEEFSGLQAQNLEEKSLISKLGTSVPASSGLHAKQKEKYISSASSRRSKVERSSKQKKENVSLPGSPGIEDEEDSLYSIQFIEKHSSMQVEAQYYRENQAENELEGTIHIALGVTTVTVVSMKEEKEEEEEEEEEEERTSAVIECINTCDEVCDHLENSTIEVIDKRCCNGCLWCCFRCFHFFSCSCWCCDNLGKWGSRLKPRKMTEDTKKVATIGSQLALTFIERPSQCLLLFWRSFELTFFVFSLIYAILEALDGFNDKGTLKILALVFGVTDSVVSVFDNIIEWKDMCKEWANRKKSQGCDIERNAGEKSNRRTVSKRGGKVVLELMKKFIVYTLIYPLLICDIYDLATPTESNPNDTLEYVVVGIGCLLTLLDVYLHRTYMLIKAARDIDKKQKEVVGLAESMCLSCCKIQWRIISHTVLIMISHVFIIVAIGFEAFETNKGRQDGENVQVSVAGWYMIACGLVLPVLSLGLFVGFNVFWIRRYFIDLFKSIFKKGEGLNKVLSEMKTKKKKKKVWQLYEQLSSEPEFSFSQKLRVVFCDWRSIMGSIVYVGLMVFFVFFAVSRVNLPVAIGLATTVLIADGLALLAVCLWLIGLAIAILMLVLLFCKAFQGRSEEEEDDCC